MRLRANQYRSQAYRLRAHPRADEHADFADRRDSFSTVYLSALPFLMAEYVVEKSFEILPGGLIFPVGFLLFWAFYYTYYKPGYLENRLTAPPAEFDLSWVPSLLMGVLIWFVKVTFVELSHLVLFQWWAPKPVPKTKPQAHAHARPQPGAQRQAHSQTRAGAPHASASKPPELLSPDLIQALQTLGLKPGCHWRDIHRQYRALAKQFHPDLNPDITDFGHRFMKVDEAYHRLAKARSKHFPE